MTHNESQLKKEKESDYHIWSSPREGDVFRSLRDWMREHLLLGGKDVDGQIIMEKSDPRGAHNKPVGPDGKDGD